MLQYGARIEFDLELVLLLGRPPSCAAVALRDLCQVDLVEAVRIAEAVFVPVRLPLPVGGVPLDDLFGGAFPIPLQVDANPTVEWHIREVYV